MLIAAITRIIARCKAAGKRVGVYGSSAAYAVRMASAGCDIVSLPPDLQMLTTAATAAVQAARAELRK